MNSVTFVVAKDQLEDGVPMACPYTLAAFLYLKGNGVQFQITEPDVDCAPCFKHGDLVFTEQNRDPRIIEPLIGLSTYWDFDRKFHYERKNVNQYKQQILGILQPLRTFVFSRFGGSESDVVYDQAIRSIRDLSNLLDHKSTFLEMNETFVNEIEASFVTVAIIIWKKMEQSPLMQELQRHTALFGLAKRFVAIHLTVTPVILDLSATLIGDLAERFKSFLKNEGEKVGVHWVYVCHFSPNNDYGLPDGTWIVKTYPPPRTPSPPRKATTISQSYECELFYLQTLQPHKITADIIACVRNDDIQCVVLRYYPRGDLRSKVGDTNLKWYEALHTLIRVSDILNVIHTFYSPTKVVYQDFKPEQFLLDGDDIIICDLESMCFEGSTYGLKETKPYKEEVGHDIPRGHGAHQKGDIFKLGKFIIALLTTIPLLDPSTGDMVTKFGTVVSKMLDEQPLDRYMRLSILRSGCSENNAREIIGLAIQCLNTNSENRPTADFIADSLYAIKEQV